MAATDTDLLASDIAWDLDPLLDGADGPEIGAVFLGQNRNGDLEWKTKGRVTAAVPGESFHFDAFVGDFVFARWAYDLETASGTAPRALFVGESTDRVQIVAVDVGEAEAAALVSVG